MKVRQAYEGRVIEARSSELKNGGWDRQRRRLKQQLRRDSRKLIQVSRTSPLSSIVTENRAPWAARSASLSTPPSSFLIEHVFSLFPVRQVEVRHLARASRTPVQPRKRQL